MLGSRMGEGSDGDGSACVDQVPHDTRCALLRKRIKDGRGLEGIALWRKAGILAGQERVCPEQGSPPGSVRSPLWANGSVHEVRYPWGETVGQAHGRGTGVLDRAADDGVRGCERAAEARRIPEGLPKRWAQ